MRNNLLILSENNEIPLVDWVTFDALGQITDFATEVALETLSVSKGLTIALVPSTQLTIMQVAIPSKRWQQVVQAVPYALEEQLAEEVEKLHFALGKRESHSNFITVAVIARAVLEAYQQSFKTINLTPSLLIPDVLAVPKPVTGWGMMPFKNRILVRTGLQTGFAIEIESLAVVLQTALVEVHPPEQIVIFRDIQPTLNLLEILQTFDIPIVEQVHEQGIVGWFAQELSKHKPLNLLQGDYRPTSKVAVLWRPWRLTASLLLVWILLFFIEQGMNYQHLRQQHQQLSEQIEQIYRQTFPEARKIVDPRAQMEQQLKRLGTQPDQGKSAEDFLALFQSLSVPFSQLNGLTIQQLDYQAGRFDIQLTSTDLQVLEQLKSRIRGSGLMVEIQVASSRRDAVESQLRVWKALSTTQ